MKSISIFGATGSIGQSTLDLIRRDRAAYDVIALTGDQNLDQLAKDAIDIGAKCVVTADPGNYHALADRVAGRGITVMAGQDSLVEATQMPAEWVMSAIVGFAGLAPGLAALERGATLALANKESMVTAGPLMLRTARENGATLLPVDSEHSAVFQALVGEDIAQVERIIITASGGAFRDWTLDQMATATPEQATKHPNWSMGQRITVDSASMFNKALEVLETKEFFEIDIDKIEVLIHPQSMIHALVGFTDGALMAHVGPADMRHAIGYALHWPERGHVPVERLDLAKIGTFDFAAPDEDKYPALRLAREVAKMGGLSGAIFNAAKERALDAFLARKIGFLDMARLVERTIDIISSASGHIDADMSLDNISQIDTFARDTVDQLIVRKTW